LGYALQQHITSDDDWTLNPKTGIWFYGN
jgi:hypothetical protein